MWSKFYNVTPTLEILNSIIPSITFAMEVSRKELPFSYIFIKMKDDKIWMDIYFKPTDTHRCLPFSSSHPNHCKKPSVQ